MKVSIVNFSGRRNGNCHDIACFVVEMLANTYETMLFEMSDIDVNPCGKCNYECLDAPDDCPVDDDIASIYTALCESDLIYFVVPNYINNPNAYFFILNERKQGIFGRKPDLLEHYLKIEKKFVVVSNTKSDSFQQIFKGHVKNKPLADDILFLATKDFEKGGIRGGLMENKQAQQLLGDFISKCR